MRKAKHPLKAYKCVSLLACTLILLRCSTKQNDPAPSPPAPYLISAEKASDVAADILKAGVSIPGNPFSALHDLSNLLKYDITIYKVQYRTTFLGKQITASGLLSIPKSTKPLPILSFQHGTIAAHTEAPTQSLGPLGMGTLYAGFASTGYITLVPDYIGFGSSANEIHPYYLAKPMATSIIDMIRAGKEYISKNNVSSNNKIFLAGYSEGGYATMVTHQLMTKESAQTFDLVASAPAAGGYDILAMKDYLLEQRTYPQPFYIAYVGLAYQKANGHQDLLNRLFNAPYAAKIPQLFNGSKGGGDINAALTTNISTLLTEEFRKSTNTTPKFKTLFDQFKRNSPIHWKSSQPIYMYHGKADMTVPYQNSVSAYDKLLKAGNTKKNVMLIELKGNHGSAFPPYVVDFLGKFSALQ